MFTKKNPFYPFLIFLLKFIVSFVVFSAIYERYLYSYNKQNKVDSYTFHVSSITSKTISFFGYKSYHTTHESQLAQKMYVNDVYVSRVVEGCNAASVMILFFSFIIAFKGSLKNTFLFATIGVAVVYVLNILRIALISIGLYKFPEYEKLLHEILFPLFIYGVIFLLWILWVNKFSFYAEINKSK